MDGPPYEGNTLFLDMDARKQLLAKGMSFQPDLVISNGDHIYWDMKTSKNKPFFDFYKENYWDPMGDELDLTVPMLDPENEETFLNVCNHQIAGLYGTTLRSTPSFFLTDDHDLFENDEFDDELATLPPDSYGINAGETTQFLYYPEFLPDKKMPYWLEGSGRTGRASGANMLNGTIRYGDLLEANLYECRRNVNYKEKHAKVVSESVERWLIDRSLDEDTRHYFQAPSLALCYTSGKLGDWYPDVLNGDDELTLDEPKPGWQHGWLAQHQRLTEALGSQKERTPVVVQGDLHACAVARMCQSEDIKYETPIEVILTGPLGTGDTGFPSSYRNTPASSSLLVDMDEKLEAVEKNGFTIIEITRDEMKFTLYTWRPHKNEPISNQIYRINNLEPTFCYIVPRQG